MKKSEILSILQREKVELKRRYGIEEIGLFGSYSTGLETRESDIDLVYSLVDGKMLTLSELIELEQSFKSDFGVNKVELVNRKYLNPIVAISMENEVIYA